MAYSLWHINYGAQVVLFANTEREAALLMARVSGARRLGDGGTGPLVVTVKQGSHGLNLQRDGDAIVCRPQAGDLMKHISYGILVMAY